MKDHLHGVLSRMSQLENGATTSVTEEEEEEVKRRVIKKRKKWYFLLGFEEEEEDIFASNSKNFFLGLQLHIKKPSKNHFFFVSWVLLCFCVVSWFLLKLRVSKTSTFFYW